MADMLTISELKKHLKALSPQELVNLICQRYKKDNKNKQILTALFVGDEYAQELLADYKQKMRGMFFAARGFIPLSSIKMLITDYKKITDNPLWTTDLMLYYVERGTDFTNDYGDIDEPFYNSLCSVFGNVVENINKSANAEIYLHLKTRLQKLVSETQHIGWGYGIYVSDAFCQIVWLEGNE